VSLAGFDVATARRTYFQRACFGGPDLVGGERNPLTIPFLPFRTRVRELYFMQAV